VVPTPFIRELPGGLFQNRVSSIFPEPVCSPLDAAPAVTSINFPGVLSLAFAIKRPRKSLFWFSSPPVPKDIRISFPAPCLGAPRKAPHSRFCW